jgi:hypothetical protein
MRIIQITSCLAISVLFFCSCACGETPGGTEIDFSVPFGCHMEESYCLTDKFKAGLNVVMVSKSGICIAKTGEAFKYEHHAEHFDATRVVGTEPCPVFKDETPFAEYYIAVVGLDSSAVRPVPPKDDKSPLVSAESNRGQVVDKARAPDPYKSFRPKSDREKTLCDTMFKAQDRGLVTGNEFCFIIVPGH